MKPNEKAWELVQKKYSDAVYLSLKSEISTTKLAKECAIICADEFLKTDNFTKEYWQEVKEEINKL